MIRSVLAAALAAALLATPAAAATPLDSDRMWVTDGAVESLARVGQTLYLGGSFRRLSPPSGSAVVLGADGVRGAGPELDGSVDATLADGAGGLYVGGRFRHADGAPVGSVIHLRADGTLDPGFAAPRVNGPVLALAVAGSHLYVGGQFSRAGAEAGFDNLVRLTLATGAPDLGYKPAMSGFNDLVGALAVSGSTLYVGGSFTQFCKAAANCLERDFAAAVDLTTLNTTAWNPTPEHDVRDLLLHDGGIYLGGSFDCLKSGGDTACDGDPGEVDRPGVAKVNLDAAGTVATGFDARLNRVTIGGVFTSDLAAAANGAVLAAGQFDCVGTYDGDGNCTDAGERVRRNVVRVDPDTGVADGFAADPDDIVDAVALNGTTLWLGGRFAAVAGTPRAHLAAVDAETGALLPPDPRPDDDVRTLAAMGAGAFAGGSFGGLGGVARSRLAAIDLQTGEPTDWAPEADAIVRQLVHSGGRLYAAGEFSSVAGSPRGGAAAFDVATGGLLPWNPQANGSVYALVPDGDRVYLGGSFGALAGDGLHARLAAVSAETGGALPFPAANGTVEALGLHAGVLYAGGSFTGTNALGSATRSFAGAVDAATGGVLPWDPAASSKVEAIAAGPDGVIVGGDFFTLGTHEAKGLGKTDPATGAVDTAWGFQSLSLSVDELVRSGTDLYVAGALNTAGAFFDVLRLDAATGARNGWEPDIESGVTSIAVSGGAVHLGGYFDSAGTRARAGLAGFTPPPAPLRAPSAALAGAGATCDPGEWEGAPLLRVSWLRDGAPAGTGTAYAVTGADTGTTLACRVTASTLRGTATADSPGVAIPAADRTAPVLSGLRFSPRRPRTRRALALRLTLSEPAALTVTVQRAVKGRRKGRRCVPGRRTGKRCTAFKRVAVLKVAGKAGANRIALPRRKLARPGRHRIVVRAVDPAGNAASARMGFTLRRAAR